MHRPGELRMNLVNSGFARATRGTTSTGSLAGSYRRPAEHEIGLPGRPTQETAATAREPAAAAEGLHEIQAAMWPR
jgi:hypothetical protein